MSIFHACLTRIEQIAKKLGGPNLKSTGKVTKGASVAGLGPYLVQNHGGRWGPGTAPSRFSPEGILNRFGNADDDLPATKPRFSTWRADEKGKAWKYTYEFWYSRRISQAPFRDVALLG